METRSGIIHTNEVGVAVPHPTFASGRSRLDVFETGKTPVGVKQQTEPIVRVVFLNLEFSLNTMDSEMPHPEVTVEASDLPLLRKVSRT